MKATPAVVVVVCVWAGGCWPQWQQLFDTTPSSEHRVQDLRVLGIRAVPAVFNVGADGVVDDVVVQPFVYDPRGGLITLRVGLCLAPSNFE